MSSLSAFNNSMASFVDNVNGLGEEVVYTESQTAVTHDTRVVRQERQNDYSQRDTTSDTVCDKEIFLIKLPIEPKKNDTILKDAKTFLVDYFEIVSAQTYRLYVVADAQVVPSPASPRWEV